MHIAFAVHDVSVFATPCTENRRHAGRRPGARAPTAGHGLSGRRLGLLNNQKANAGRLLDAVADELQRRAGPFEEIREVKAAPAAAPTDVMGRLQRCDAVVLAIAD